MQRRACAHRNRSVGILLLHIYLVSFYKEGKLKGIEREIYHYFLNGKSYESSSLLNMTSSFHPIVSQKNISKEKEDKCAFRMNDTTYNIIEIKNGRRAGLSDISSVSRMFGNLAVPLRARILMPPPYLKLDYKRHNRGKTLSPNFQ